MAGQHHYAVGDVDCFFDVMRDQDGRHTELSAEVQHEVLEWRTGLRVDRGERLLQEEYRWTVRECPGDDGALVHAVRIAAQVQNRVADIRRFNCRDQTLLRPSSTTP
jgi:hypothetical protein